MDSSITLKAKAYEHIKNLIIEGKLLPGDIIDEKKLSSELSISRTPVHEALSQLSQDGFLTIMPRRGTIVSHISIQDVRDVYEMRKLIEPQALKLALPNIDKKKLEEFKDIYKGKKKVRDLDPDASFHNYLASCTHNKLLIKCIEDLMVKSARIRTLSSKKVNERLEGSYSEHIAIIDYLVKGDAAKAEDAMLSHLKKSEEGYKNIYSSSTYFEL